jgi:hypothetical protein
MTTSHNSGNERYLNVCDAGLGERDTRSLQFAAHELGALEGRPRVIPQALSADWTCGSLNPPPGPPEGPPLGKPEGGDPEGEPVGKPLGAPAGRLAETPAALRHFWIFFSSAGSCEKPPPGPPDGNPWGESEPVDEDDEPQPVRAARLIRPTSDSVATRWLRRGDMEVPLGGSVQRRVMAVAVIVSP